MIISKEVENKRVFDESVELPISSILRRRPELYDEWNFEKNDVLNLDVYKVTHGSEKIAWWNCPDCKTTYDMDLKTRAGRGAGKAKGSNCPYCAGKRINYTNSLESLYPELAKEWHPTLNNELTPCGFTRNSGEKVWWLCLECDSPYDTVINDRTGEKNSNCSYCAGKKVNHTNSLASQYPNLASEWHPALNGDLTPHDRVSGSHEIVWWLGKCNHHWYAAVEDRTKENGTNCPYCTRNPEVLKGFNDMWTTNPEQARMLLNPEDGYMHTQSSNTKVDWRCLECSNVIKSKTVNKINYRGLSCPQCSDGIKFPEKFMYNLLKEASIDFVFDKTQRWSEKARYDFYLPDYNWIIETHGGQHFGGQGFSGYEGARSLQEERENDRLKEYLAKENGIDNYIIIDSRHSTVKWMKNSILNSDIMKIVEDIDFERVGRLASNSFVKTACDLWNSGIRSTSEIAEVLKLTSATVRSYLKRGVEIGWCDYCPVEVRRITAIKVGKSSGRAIVQLSIRGEFIKEWDSATNASMTLNNKRSSHISSVCKNERNTTLGFKWMYKEDYDKLNLVVSLTPVV